MTCSTKGCHREVAAGLKTCPRCLGRQKTRDRIRRHGEGRISVGTECECGAAKGRRAECCARCRYLDGGLLLDVIQELRTSEPCTISELAAATGRKRASLLKQMHRLLRAGRVAQLVDADEGLSAERSYVLVDRGVHEVAA